MPATATNSSDSVCSRSDSADTKSLNPLFVYRFITAAYIFVVKNKYYTVGGCQQIRADLLCPTVCRLLILS